jgi:superoxide dismutase
MRFRIAPLFCRPWTLNGMSPRLIESHYEHYYGAALSRLNTVTHELEAIDIGAATPQMISRLKREQIDLLNATLLHELYFASLGGDGRMLPEMISNAITRDFGLVERWRQEFIALAEALAGDAGWILLSYVPRLATIATGGHRTMTLDQVNGGGNMATPELLMTSKRSALAWRNCAVSARGQMLRERTVGRFSRRVETAVIC